MIGIDLGTTSSCVAVMKGSVPQVIPNQEGDRTTPSVVGFTADGQVLVGEFAKQHALANARTTVSAVTRLIGLRFDSPEVQDTCRFLPAQVVEAPGGGVHFQIGDRALSPLEICSLLLKKLKEAAENDLGQAVEHAVIAVPAYFDYVRRQAIKDAGRMAGLRVARVVAGSTAAALAYGLKNSGKNGQFVAVYDLGGGTFDITILEMADGLFQVRATGGDTYLGGEDFDQRIIDWLIGEFQRETGIDLTQDRTALQRLKEAAEKAKCELSTAQQTEIALPFISADASGPKHLNTVLTRQRYEELTDALLERTIEPCRRCLNDAGMKPEQIDEVLLVGGQTRAPKVTEMVRKLFGKEPNRTLDPDQGVAVGAAVYAGTIQGEVKDLVLLDVTPLTLGIETKDGTFTSLIERNSTTPTRKSRVFTTVADNQTRVEVHILEGESDMAAYNKSLAKFELTSIPPAPKGVPQIEVTFEIDVNGITSVNAQDQATGRRQNMVIHEVQPGQGTPRSVAAESGTLTDDASGLALPGVTSHTVSTTADNQTGVEVHVLQGKSDVAAYYTQAAVDRLVPESRSHGSKDEARTVEEAIVQQLDGLVANTMRAVQALESKLTDREQERIFAAIERAREARGEASLDQLKDRLEEMERAAGIIGQAMLRP